MNTAAISLTSAENTETAKLPVKLEDQIRRRAYELYEQRGREDGHDMEDWLLAELEVVQKRAKAASA
jgi:hypothetical protein